MRRSAALTWVARQIGDRGIVNFIQAPDFPSQRPAHCPLTLGNVGGSPTPGNHTAETGLAGWGARIRTWEWRNRLKSACGWYVRVAWPTKRSAGLKGKPRR